MDIPSYIVQVGDVVSLREKSRNLDPVVQSIESRAETCLIISGSTPKQDGANFCGSPPRRRCRSRRQPGDRILPAVIRHAAAFDVVGVALAAVVDLMG